MTMDKQIFSEQITMTRSERQRLESLQRRRSRRPGGGSIAGDIILVILLACAAVLLYALIQMRVTGKAPELAGRQFYIVAGSGMEPAFGPGSLLAVKAVKPEDLTVDDVIIFTDPANPAQSSVSRIAAVNSAEGLTFTIRGDASGVDEPAPVPGESILGIGEFTIPYAGYILDFARTRSGLIYMLLVPALLIVIFEFGKLLRSAALLEKRHHGKRGGSSRGSQGRW